MSTIFLNNSKDFINFSNIDTYNKPFNLIICPREAGKTAQLEFIKIYKTLINNRGSVIILKRYENEVNTATIDILEKRINRYLNANQQIKISDVKGLSTGCVSFNLKRNKDTFKSCLLVWLGRLQKIKNSFIENVRYIIFDEYVVNPKSEKYQPNEFNKIIELYQTIRRYTPQKIRFYFCGNPYSKFNPFVDYFNVPTKKLAPHKILLGNEWLVWCYQLTTERIEELKKDPIYHYDNEYANFALSGVYSYDDKIKQVIEVKQPENFKLYCYFYYNDTLLAVFLNYFNTKNYIYYIKNIKEKFKGSKKYVYTFNCYDNSQNLDYLIAEPGRFESIKRAIKANQVRYSSVKACTCIFELYEKL